MIESLFSIEIGLFLLRGKWMALSIVSANVRNLILLLPFR